MIQSVTVYCSSSSAVAEPYFVASKALGLAIADAGWTLVYGGNYLGLMGELADGARAGGGRVIGITPQLLADKGVNDTRCDEMIVTATLRERKQLLESRGDGLVALPGGIGTLEELFEVLVAKQLGYHTKPIVLLNICGYFDPLLTMLDAGIAQRFIKPSARELMFVAADVQSAVEYLRQHAPHPAQSSSFDPQPPSALE